MLIFTKCSWCFYEDGKRMRECILFYSQIIDRIYLLIPRVASRWYSAEWLKDNVSVDIIYLQSSATGPAHLNPERNIDV